MKRKLVWTVLLIGCSLMTINAWGNRTISFTADLTGDLDIYIMDINRKDLVNLTNHPAADSSPTWTPDGSAFAFVLHRDGNPEIYVMDMKNNESRRLTNNRATDIDPAWSPDGHWIAYVSTQGNNKDIHLIRAADGEIQRLTQEPGLEFSPAWVPAGLAVLPNTQTQTTLWGILKQIGLQPARR